MFTFFVAIYISVFRNYIIVVHCCYRISVNFRASALQWEGFFPFLVMPPTGGVPIVRPVRTNRDDLDRTTDVTSVRMIKDSGTVRVATNTKLDRAIYNPLVYDLLRSK